MTTLKKLPLFACFFMISVHMAPAQTLKTSTGDGNWDDPGIWTPAGIPAGNDSVIVDSDVMLTDDVSLDGGFLKINNGAELNGGTKELSLNNMNLLNEGTLILDDFSHSSGYMDNRDEISSLSSLVIASDSVYNHGTIAIGSSLESHGTIMNATGGTIDITSDWDCQGGIRNDGTVNVGSDFDNMGDGYSDSVATFMVGSSFTQQAMSFDNQGQLNVNSSMDMLGIRFDNSGEMTVGNSLTSTGDFYNAANAVLDIGSSLNNEQGIFSNAGEVTTGSSVNSAGDFTNTGIIQTGSSVNNDNLSFHNGGMIHTGSSLNNNSRFVNDTTGQIELSFSFRNQSDTFTNHGIVLIDSIWYNASGAVVNGYEGTFCVYDSSVNEGILEETVDVCDTTPVSQFPYLDRNTGSVGVDVTFCAHPQCGKDSLPIDTSMTGIILVKPRTAISIYPVPVAAGEPLYLQVSGFRAPMDIRVYNTLGKEVLNHRMLHNTMILSTSGLTKGVYCFRVNNRIQTIGQGKFIVR